MSLLIFSGALLKVFASEDTDTVFLKCVSIDKNLETFIEEKVMGTSNTLWPKHHNKIGYDVDFCTPDTIYIFATDWGNFGEEYIVPLNNASVCMINNRPVFIKSASDNPLIKNTHKKKRFITTRIPAINERTIMWILAMDGNRIKDLEFGSGCGWRITEDLPEELYSLPNVVIRRLPYEPIHFSCIADEIKRISPPERI